MYIEFLKHAGSKTCSSRTPFLVLCFLVQAAVSNAESAHVSNGAGVPILDTESILATHLDDQRSYRPVISWSLPVKLWQKTLTLQTKYIEAPEAPPTLEEMLDGGRRQSSVLRFRLAAPIFDRVLTSETEFSYLFSSHQTKNYLGSPENRLARLRLAGEWQKITYAAELRSVGKNFINIDGPGVIPDREGGEIWAERKFGSLKLRASLGSFWDNLDLDRHRARMTTTLGSVTAHLARAPWPSFGFAYTRRTETSSREPDGEARQRRWIDTWEFSVKRTLYDWRPFFSSFFSVTQDRLLPQNSVVSHRHHLAASYQPTRAWLFTPSITWEEIKSRVNPRRVFTIGMVNRFKESKFDLQWTITTLFRQEKTPSEHSREIDLRSGVSWLFYNETKDRNSVSLQVTYRQAKDPVSGKSENFSVWLAFTLKRF